MVPHKVIPAGRRALPTPLTPAEKITLAATINADVTTLLDVELVDNNIHWRDTGNDANDGSTGAQAVATFARVAELLHPTKFNRILVLGNLNLDRRISCVSGLVGTIRSAVSNNPATINIVDATNVVGFSGGFSPRGAFSLEVFNLNINLDCASSFGFVSLLTGCGVAGMYYNGCTFSASATNTSFLTYSAFGSRAHTDFGGSPIGPISGNVFNGVAAGNNPNNLTQHSSNLQAG